ncbi:MAG: hypothetical protein ACLFO6_02345 [Archaeoglobaceae archaeon]
MGGKKYVVDKSKNVLVVKKDSVVDRHLKFDGKIIAGMYSCFWGNLEAKEISLGKGCYVRGNIICQKIVVGSNSQFNTIRSSGDVLIQNKCKGGAIKSGSDVRIQEGSTIKSVVAEGNLIVDGDSKIDSVSAKKVVASKDAKPETPTGSESEPGSDKRYYYRRELAPLK